MTVAIAFPAIGASSSAGLCLRDGDPDRALAAGWPELRAALSPVTEENELLQLEAARYWACKAELSGAGRCALESEGKESDACQRLLAQGRFLRQAADDDPANDGEALEHCRRQFDFLRHAQELGLEREPICRIFAASIRGGGSGACAQVSARALLKGQEHPAELSHLCRTVLYPDLKSCEETRTLEQASGCRILAGAIAALRRRDGSRCLGEPACLALIRPSAPLCRELGRALLRRYCASVKGEGR